MPGQDHDMSTDEVMAQQEVGRIEPEFIEIEGDRVFERIDVSVTDGDIRKRMEQLKRELETPSYVHEKPVVPVEVWQCLMQEILHGRERYPSNRHQALAFAEESGELIKAILDHHQGKATANEVFAEAMQAASMALRLILEGDSDLPYVYDRIQAEAFLGKRKML